MPHYLVFFGRRGASSIVWRPEENPAGVFEGNTPDEACAAASQYLGVMGSFYAIEGHFWGVMPGNVPNPYGTAMSAADRTAATLEKLIKVAEQQLLAAGAPPAEIEGKAEEDSDKG